jgi:hypothetical protein
MLSCQMMQQRKNQQWNYFDLTQSPIFLSCIYPFGDLHDNYDIYALVSSAKKEASQYSGDAGDLKLMAIE